MKIFHIFYLAISPRIYNLAGSFATNYKMQFFLRCGKKFFGFLRICSISQMKSLLNNDKIKNLK
jgi:hypothetical protein